MRADGGAIVRRLLACLFGGVVLAMMVGSQEGTLTDFGISFREAVLRPRIVLFLLIGFAVFVLITFWPLVVPYLHRPGVLPLSLGLVTVIAAQTVMNWYDPLANTSGSGKFNAVRSAADASPALPSISTWFFDWLAWASIGVILVGCGATIVTRLRPVGYVVAVLALAAAVVAYIAHRDVVNLGQPGIDHSLGVYADVIGFLVMAGAALTAVQAHSDTADTRAFIRTVTGFRPGLPLVAVGLILGALSFSTAGWFGTSGINDTLSKASSDFGGTAISGLASAYLSWLGYALFGVSVVLAGIAAWLRHRVVAWVGLALSVVAVLLTFLTLKSMTAVGAGIAPQYGAHWKNLGTGGFAACMAFSLFAAAMVGVLSSVSRLSVRGRKKQKAGDKSWAEGLPVTSMVRGMSRSSQARSLLVVAGAVALFYPPTLPVTWQNVLVSQIGVFVLLSIGLNVVVGWAGLLDLGYIAFYEIGSYTTAYLVGALPVKPPHWLHMPVLLTIPFAIIACLIAGILLGAPTLRLRGDYLAIVTLGFGEIIQIVAVNNPFSFTGGPQGPSVPHPRIALGPIDITWGQDNLPYWYLLLIMLVVVLVLFYRLEGSRIGRAWAAIREDEVAAQASGVNTVRVKLLAFAIGASTSALAGSFFASQIGYFDPSLFTLQASILIVAYVVFGGMGSLPGAMAGAAALTWLPQFLKAQVPSDDRQMWIGALLLGMMIFRPAGLLPARRRKAELEGLDSAGSSEVAAVPASEGM